MCKVKKNTALLSKCEEELSRGKDKSWYVGENYIWISFISQEAAASMVKGGNS